MMDKERCTFKGRAGIRDSVALAPTLCFGLSCLFNNGSAHQLAEGDRPAEAPRTKPDFQCVSDNAVHARGSAGGGTFTGLSAPMEERSP